MAKLDDDRVRTIRAEYARGGFTQTQIARRHGVSQAFVSNILRRRTWRHVPPTPSFPA